MASKFKPVRTNVSTRLNTVEVMVTGKKKLGGSGGAGASCKTVRGMWAAMAKSVARTEDAWPRRARVG